MPNFREGIELGQEFIDGKVGNRKFPKLKGGGFGLPTDRDHRIHIVRALGDVADFKLNALTVKVADGFGTPWAAGFYIKDGFCFWLIFK